MSNSSIWPIDRTLSSATTQGLRGPGSNGNEGVLRIPQTLALLEPHHQFHFNVILKTPVMERRRYLTPYRGAVVVFYCSTRRGGKQTYIHTYVYTYWYTVYNQNIYPLSVFYTCLLPSLWTKNTWLVTVKVPDFHRDVEGEAETEENWTSVKSTKDAASL